jgi:hypothetical protein
VVNENVQNYVDFFQRSLSRVPMVAAGFVYALVYQPHAGVRNVVDNLPLVLATAVDLKKRTMRGMSFYRLPMRARDVWLARMHLIARDQIESDRVRRVPDLTAERLKQLTEMATLAMRTYSLKRVADMRVVPYSQLDEAVALYNKIPSER